MVIKDKVGGWCRILTRAHRTIQEEDNDERSQ